ncbi:membrane protein [Kitasatospora sp. MMS16-BH015]|uniref:YihY/virulence factor BrkB family protein n=1 Tax=Kitasatospora sp. MMS16-BH015 TaxID=2018025 RepID=UPI000CA19FD2|nr:YihY/virulence factor BrkB family protein [Kitasatospora sp. MMS16-BH015]AUG77661.1 membrane protein [Kitasatospora sp. MMS16-BH015]
MSLSVAVLAQELGAPVEKLAKLPVIGPLVTWLLRTRAYRTYAHFTETKGNRLAGAVTFFGFLALFPLLTVALAVAVATLNGSQVHRLQDKISEQLPGLSDSLNLPGLIANAGTVGLISGLLLVISGLGWVDTIRGAIRDVWLLPEEDGNIVLRKAWDCVVLLGLGLVTAVSLGASAVATQLARHLADAIGLDGTAGRYLLGAASYLIAVIADTVLFAYLLAPFPRITDQHRRDVLGAALIGAVGFEVLKILLASYLGSVATKNIYGAFGTPIALLLWINFVSRLLMYCVSWTALADPAAARQREITRAEQILRKAD